ncbi:MAG: STAS-like domain-containing protein [Treponema sp.]|nr:STAS-like domain-containing protein [Treponema sp.]
MTINIADFGDVLVSRPSGREAFLGASSYLLNGADNATDFVLDFAGVKVLTPSWADEFIRGLKETYSSHISYINTDNESVKASLDILTA